MTTYICLDDSNSVARKRSSVMDPLNIMLSIYLNSSTCKYLSLDNGVTMTSKRHENIKLTSQMRIKKSGDKTMQWTFGYIIIF